MLYDVNTLIADQVSAQLARGESILTIGNEAFGDPVTGRYASYMVFINATIAEKLAHPDELEITLAKHFADSGWIRVAIFVTSNKNFAPKGIDSLKGIMQIAVICKINDHQYGPSAESVENIVKEALAIPTTVN